MPFLRRSFVWALTVALSFSACQSTEAEAQSRPVSFSIQGTLSGGSADSLLLVEVHLGKINRLAAAKLASGAFTLKGSAPQPGLYTLIADGQFVTQLALDRENTFSLALTASQGSYSTTYTGSKLNEDLSAYLRTTQDAQRRLQQIMGQVQAGAMTQAAAQAAADSMRKSLQLLHEQTAQRPDLLGLMGALYSYKPYGSEAAHTRYPSEIDYFKRGFFADSKLNDPRLAGLPLFYDKVQAYVGNLIQMGTPAAEVQRWVDSLRRHVAPNPRADQAILYTAMGAAEQLDPDLFAAFGATLLAQHPTLPLDPAIRDRIKALARVRVGELAPEIALNSPTGTPVKLSSLRGKVVMIDFWASWCGPCRRENPNVVKLYQRFKERGFEIYGVSLDRDRAGWLQAIEADKLTWLHVSDLGYWQSAAAKDYGVTGIPFTLLLDPEGRIIAKNLRGKALEDKLTELFN